MLLTPCLILCYLFARVAIIGTPSLVGPLPPRNSASTAPAADGTKTTVANPNSNASALQLQTAQAQSPAASSLFEPDRPLAAWRRALLLPCRALARVALFLIGFHYIPVRGDCSTAIGIRISLFVACFE